MDSERQSRREALKSILKELHQGKEPKALKARFAQLLEDVTPGDIGKLEQELVREGLEPEEIARLCDLHVQLFQKASSSNPVRLRSKYSRRQVAAIVRREKRRA